MKRLIEGVLEVAERIEGAWGVVEPVVRDWAVMYGKAFDKIRAAYAHRLDVIAADGPRPPSHESPEQIREQMEHFAAIKGALDKIAQGKATSKNVAVLRSSAEALCQIWDEAKRKKGSPAQAVPQPAPIAPPTPADQRVKRIAELRAMGFTADRAESIVSREEHRVQARTVAMPDDKPAVLLTAEQNSAFDIDKRRAVSQGALLLAAAIRRFQGHVAASLGDAAILELRAGVGVAVVRVQEAMARKSPAGSQPGNIGIPAAIMSASAAIREVVPRILAAAGISRKPLPAKVKAKVDRGEGIRGIDLPDFLMPDRLDGDFDSYYSIRDWKELASVQPKELELLEGYARVVAEFVDQMTLRPDNPASAAGEGAVAPESPPPPAPGWGEEIKNCTIVDLVAMLREIATTYYLDRGKVAPTGYLSSLVHKAEFVAHRLDPQPSGEVGKDYVMISPLDPPPQSIGNQLRPGPDGRAEARLSHRLHVVQTLLRKFSDGVMLARMKEKGFAWGVEGFLTDEKRDFAGRIEAAADELSEMGKAATHADIQPEAGLAAQPKRFRVALSFPGEHRTFVEAVAEYLSGPMGRDRVLYDKFHEAEFARLNLDTHLQRLYHDESELIAVFLCAEYERKDWCGLEWRAIRDLIKKRQDSAIMPFRFDRTEIPGLFSIDGYIDIKNRSPKEVADLILQRMKTNSVNS